jgi:uncharacterized protein YyaL (SSP411 family)
MAILWQKEMIRKFWDEEAGGFLLSDNADKHLLFRFQQESDGVTPTTNSLSASNLLRLTFLTEDQDLAEVCERLVGQQSARLADSPLSLPYFAVALAENERLRKIQIENPGQETEKLRSQLRSQYHPFALLAGKSGSTEQFSVCTRKACLSAVKSAEEVWKQL